MFVYKYFALNVCHYLSHLILKIAVDITTNLVHTVTSLEMISKICYQIYSFITFILKSMVFPVN